MFDTLGSGYGGTGKKFNWNLLKDVNLNKLFFLSGGIEPGDEENLKMFAGEPIGRSLFAVDINSRFEISPGLKDMEKVTKFVSNLNDQKIPPKREKERKPLNNSLPPYFEM